MPASSRMMPAMISPRRMGDSLAWMCHGLCMGGCARQVDVTQKKSPEDQGKSSGPGPDAAPRGGGPRPWAALGGRVSQGCHCVHPLDRNTARAESCRYRQEFLAKFLYADLMIVSTHPESLDAGRFARLENEICDVVGVARCVRALPSVQLQWASSQFAPVPRST